MKKNLFISFLLLLFVGNTSFSQTTISTAVGTTNYNGTSTTVGNSSVTFVIENTNGYGIILDSIQAFKGVTYPLANAKFYLWYSATKLSDTSTINVANGWVLIDSTNPLTLVAGYNTIFSTLGFVIPAATQYRFALRSTAGSSFSGTATVFPTPSILSDGGVNLHLGDDQIAGANVGYAGVFPKPLTNPRWFTGAISFRPNLPCTTPPTAGKTTASSTTLCAKDSFSLGITGADFGTGLTYQWDSSTNGTTWFPIAGATKRTLKKAQAVTSSYRCTITCASVAASSTPIVITSQTATSGTFTINSGSPTGGSNFATFTEAISRIGCGINGPVVLNVAPGSGPYKEQIVIPVIPGTSNINTITINGNGATLAAFTTATNRAVLTLNGTDHLTLDSLLIDSTIGTNTSWGILLMNKADSNTIKRCTINVNTTFTTTVYAGIIINGSNNASGTSGNNGNGNLIANNKISGGYYSIYIWGSSSGSDTLNIGNKVVGNICTDMYSQSIVANYTSGLIISKNDISRPSRLNSGVIYGVSLGTNCYGALVEKNSIHNMFDGIPTNTSIFYGIYDATKARAGREVKIYNNIIYNINSNGAAYGIYNTGGDSMWAYHNTIVLDDAATTTGAAYGFYQITTASGIVFRNNIVYLTRSGTGIKRSILLNTTTSDVVCNNNGFYFNPTTGTNNNFGQYGTTNFTTFANWQTANAKKYDQQSVEDDPLFVNAAAGDLTPAISSLNNICPNLGVTTDINGATRGGTPDPGAVEFTPPPCVNPPTAGTAISSVTDICPNTTFSLNLTGNSIGSSQTYIWQRSANGTTGWTAVSTASTGTNLNLSQTATSYYRCGVKCGSGTIVYTATILVTSPPLVSGTFTINSGAVTGGTNFATFADAITFLGCGISGPVVFNVVANSGPYNERIILPAITGTSIVNTITINGNGNTLNYPAPDNNNRVAVTLNGTDHVIIDSLIVDVSAGTTAGWGILLTNQADSNIIKKCSVLNNTTSISTNYIDILINGSNTLTGTSGNNGSYNQFIGNTLVGGYYGYYLYGNLTLGNTQNNGNVIKNNTVTETYSYAMYCAYQTTGLLVSQNDISRPSRTNSGTIAGVFLTGYSSGALIEKNRIHNLFDAFTTSTSVCYGIYVGADGKPGLENKIINNVLYNISSNGIVYGIYNTGGDSMWAYHNTIVIDNAATTTGASYGLYQTGVAVAVEFKNNLIYIARGGTGIKRCVYFGTTTSNIASNNNLLYLNAVAGTNNNVAQYGTSNYATLTDWRTANSNAFDQSSISIDPIFTNPTPDDYIPSNILVNAVGANVGVTSDINGKGRTISPDPGAFEFDIAGCTGTPIAGTSISSVTTNACSGYIFTLDLTGNTVASGLSYQWEKSTNGTSGWTSIGTASGNPSYSLSQTITSYYRCAVKCNAASAVYSTVIKLITPTPVSGTFTINNGVVTGGSNFQSFSEAFAAISCSGVNGPIILNVSPGSGPYVNDSIYIPQIKGVSATNKIVINGNGASLNYTTGSINSRAAVILNGADNVTLDSLIIDVSAGTYGWGIVLMNQADSNTIKRCNIITNTLATSINYGGIAISGSAISNTVLGNNGNYNTITNNTITGGSFGISVYGSLNSTQNIGNKILNNTVLESYNYGIEAFYQNGLVISKNDISRPTRTNTSFATYGIYLSTNCLNSLVEKNRIHNLFDGQTISTSTTYAIYVSAKAKAGQENKIINNLVYNMTGNGPIYGIYNTAGDSMQAYHNSIVLDDAAATTGTTYGFYQTGVTNGIDFRNNLIAITRAGTGLKRCIALTTTTNVLRSNNNIFYLNAPAGTNNELGQFGGATAIFTTLNDWKTANGGIYDSASVETDPLFSATGLAVNNYIPTPLICDNTGAKLAATTDIIEVARSLSAPDAGAFEFGTIPSSNYSFNGQFITPNKKAINKVSLTIKDGTGIKTSLALGGAYSASVSGTYIAVTPTKNNDLIKNSGVSGIDVILVTNHILNKIKLNNAYKIIAADVTGDKKITAIDAIYMKRLILGIDTTYTASSGKRLWTFIDSAYQFPDTTNPFPVKDSIYYNDLGANKKNQTFIGVKLGDVNYDWNPAAARGVANKPVEFMYQEPATTADDIIKIPITVNNFNRLVTMQYTLKFNEDDYEFVAIERNKLNIDFNDKQAAHGNISFLWSDPNALAKTVENGSDLFTLVLKKKITAIFKLEINNDITEIEAWDKDYNRHNIILKKQPSTAPQKINNFIIYPNPAKTFICLNIETLVGDGQIVVSDLFGKPIKMQLLSIGNNIVDIANLTKGFYTVSIITTAGKFTKKLVVE
jgi:hypothetical protein